VNKKTFVLMSFLALISFLFIYSACNKGTTSINQSPTDYVTITDINSRITDADVKAGVQKTNNYMSPVKMSHKKHENSGVQCFTCHHKKGNDDRIKQCAACHKGKKADATMHNICMNCHLEKKLGPVMCQDCHKEQVKE
jgi:hypothetical protein